MKNQSVCHEKKISSCYSFEQRVYEMLGIKFFRKLVFRLERLIHKNDHGRNTNYHIASFEVTETEAFIKYLFYNRCRPAKT